MMYFEGSDWISLLPLVGTALFIGYVTFKAFFPSSSKASKLVNRCVSKDKPKVVNVVEVEDLDKEKESYCRCWKSKKVRMA